MNRPGGDYGDPRWSPLKKGEKVAIRSVYNSKTEKEGSKPYDWVFITHWNYKEKRAGLVTQPQRTPSTTKSKPLSLFSGFAFCTLL